MVAVTSQIDANSEAFAANRASMMTFIERLRALEARASEARPSAGRLSRNVGSYYPPIVCTGS